jgi:hypothetical protein
MKDWADQKAEEIVDEPGILQVWHEAGYCRECKQVLAGSAINLTKLKQRIAETIREIMLAK